MQIVVDVICLHTNFSVHGFSGFGDKNNLSNMAKFPFRPEMDIYSPW